MSVRASCELRSCVCVCIRGVDKNRDARVHTCVVKHMTAERHFVVTEMSMGAWHF